MHQLTQRFVSKQVFKVQPASKMKQLLSLCVFLWCCAGLMAQECLTEYCRMEVENCEKDMSCAQGLECITRCVKMWANDTTPQKFKAQNCTNICAFTYADEAFVAAMTCAIEHKCVELPPIPDRCLSERLKIQKKVTVRDLEGSWWVVKGGNQVYDCYPCQHWSFREESTTRWIYQPTYEVYLEDGSLKMVNQTIMWDIPDPMAASEVSFEYTLVGLPLQERWYLFDMAEDGSYVLVYYCGHALDWYHDGAVVLSKEKILPEADMMRVETSFREALGIDIATEFCNTRTMNCPVP